MLRISIKNQIVLTFVILFSVGYGNGRKNVLFLVSDDMRPELGAYYGPDFPSPVHPYMHTPTLDALAKKSLLLKRAYVQQALCGPSRSSLLTARRPDTTHVYKCGPDFRQTGGNFTTLPEYFKLNGYRTVGMGKIFHPGHNDDPPSWSDPYYHAPVYRPYANETKKCRSWWAVPKDVSDQYPLQDVMHAERAVKTLREVTPAALSGETPFFVAVGFHKPHLPFIFPEEYLKYYPRNEIRIPDNPFAPVYMPDIAWNNCGRIRYYDDMRIYHLTGKINDTFPHDVIIDLRRAYYSAVSYIDDLFGTVIKELEDLGLANNTIISFFGDHGWQLGEHGEWCKQTNFEDAVHAPMMIHVPGLTDSGIVTERMVEFVDLFPSLVEAAGLDQLPLCPEKSTNTTLCREGTSFMPLVEDPKKEWKTAVYSQYARPRPGEKIYDGAMGYSIRTDKYRYTEWVEFSMAPNFQPNWNKVYGIELYDHFIDPEENLNRANFSGYADIKKQLSDQLHSGWRYSLPSNEL